MIDQANNDYNEPPATPSSEASDQTDHVSDSGDSLKIQLFKKLPEMAVLAAGFFAAAAPRTTGIGGGIC